MKATSANLLTVIKGPKQFVIPIYQRTYSWHRSQCEQLFKDILRISKSDSIHGHFIGSIVYFQESIQTISDVPQLLVIDGQQRLATITLLIAALAEFIEINKIEIETNPVKLRNYYLLNAEEDNELRYKLLLTRRDKETMMDILKGVNPGEYKSLRIAENYKFFKDKINLENVTDVYNGLLRLFIVDVALEKGIDNPQLIFESLNSTGLDLSQSDLTRNYVLMDLKPNLQTELYEKYWYPMEQNYGNEYANRFDWFIRDYLCVKTGKIPTVRMIYEDFKKYVQNNDSHENIAELVADIHRFSNFYVNIVLHKEPDTKLNRAFKRISRLKVDVSFPFLLAVYNDYAEGTLSSEDFFQILCLVENYVFRRAICGIPTNSLNKTFANFYKSIHKENYLQSVQAAFLSMDSYKRFPTDSEFEKEIIAKMKKNKGREYEEIKKHPRGFNMVIAPA